jgi:lysophospholipase L1-like esterase
MARLILPGTKLLNPNTVVALGDSRVAQIHADAPSAFRNKTAYNHFSMGNALANNRAILVQNLGVSGDRTDQALARLPAALASGAQWLYIHVGVNDIAQAYPTATTSGVTAWLNIKTMIDSAVAIGMRPIVVLEPGANNFSTAQIGQLIILQQYEREYAETCPGMILFDLPAALYNPAATSTTALAIQGSIDGTHEGNLGGYLGGAAFSSLLQSIMPTRPHGTRSQTENPTTSLTNLMANGMFTTTTGGVLGGGNSGTVAGSWTGSRTNTSTGAYSVGTASDGSGLTEQVMACTFAAAGDEVNIHQDAAIGNWSPGDIVQASAEVSVDSGSSNLAGVYLYVQANGSGNGTSAQTAMDGYCVGLGAGPTTAYKTYLLTEKLVIPNFSTKTWLTCHVKAVAAGAGSATVRVRRVQLRKRFT